MRRQRFGFSGKFSAFVIPVALVIPSARIASITGKRVGGPGCGLRLPRCRRFVPQLGVLQGKHVTI
jgi:hypothetical protein